MPLQKPLLLPHIINEVCLSCDHPMEYDSVYDGSLQRRPNLLTAAAYSRARHARPSQKGL